MLKESDRDILIQEISGDYKDFTRDTLIIGAVTFGLMFLIGYIMQLEWIWALVLGLMSMGGVMAETLFTKQLFRFAFNDRAQQLEVSYRRFFVKRKRQILYGDLSFFSNQTFRGKGEESSVRLKLYEKGNHVLTIHRKKYGWTAGLVQEVVKSLKYRKVNLIS
jgi:hypothetical protein